MHGADLPLIGRAPELERVSTLVEAAVAGRSGALVVSGVAGIGKTALLDAAGALARERGLTVLRARAPEAEQGHAFAGLRELLSPALGLLPRLDPHHAVALEVALGLRDGAPQAVFAVSIALLALLEAAEEDGLLVLLDDVQWLDDGSFEAVVFAIRRLHAEGVAVLLASRPEPDRGLRERGLEHLELSGLPADEARALAGRAGGGIAALPLEQLVAAVEGHPLALVELASSLTPDQRAGVAPLAEPLRPGPAVERAFRGRLDALPAATGDALAVAAADEHVSRAEAADAIRRLGLPGDALDAAQRAGILERDGVRWRFRHPLLRATAYHRVPLERRRAAHRALAEDAGPERRAWHRAAASDGPDEAVAGELEAVAGAVTARGALGSAAELLSRAAELSPDAHDRGRRRVAAAAILAAIGDPARGLPLVAAALAEAPDDPLLRADLGRVHGMLLARGGRLEEGLRIVGDAAEAVAPLDPARAAEMLLEAAPGYWMPGHFDRMAEIAARVGELAGDELPGHADVAGLVRALVLALTGRPGEAVSALRSHAGVLERGDVPNAGTEMLSTPAHVAVWTEHDDLAERILSRQLAAGRARRAPGELIYPLAVQGELALRTGRLGPAVAAGTEAVTLALDANVPILLAPAGGLLAQTEAALGREGACREHAGMSLQICALVDGASMGLSPRSALGLLELGLGRPDEALPWLEACAADSARIGMREPNMVRWHANRVEALVRRGRGRAGPPAR
ncbi:AAA family ATPase, partial [Patulibacter sp. NPDC049589]|uniref:AAA family ATPase n=1 Tax=Patulibacter sp. NPDC049589 TaxID=3154731 RepID=UPI003420740E